MKDKKPDFEFEEKKDENSKRDARRHMTWFALFGMLFYPITIVIVSVLDLNTATTALTDIAPTYFVSVAAIVGAFFGFDKQ